MRTTPEPDIETDTDPQDDRRWVREYVTLGAVQGDFREPSALAAVERAQHPTNPDELTYVVRQVVQFPADTSPQVVSCAAAHLATSMGARRCILDATTAGASILRQWDSQIESPREFYPVHIGDRGRTALSPTARYTITTANRLDLLSSVRMALGVAGGLQFRAAATTDQADAKTALDEYVASTPRLAPGDEEWSPPARAHLVTAFSLAVWQLMERPKDLCTDGSLAPSSSWADRFRMDLRRLRDMSVIEERKRMQRDAVLRAPHLKGFAPPSGPSVGRGLS